ncbi:MAG: ornithine cyclodeaminase family protein [Natronomonas sp.]
METLLLGHEAIRQSAPMDRIIDAVSEAFVAYHRGDVVMPAKSYIELSAYDGDFRSMPAYLSTDTFDAAGIKWVNVHPNNPESFELPTVMGTMIYSDPANGFPRAVMDGTTLTRLRTGAAAAVATDHLAVSDATSLGIVGAGVQSYAQLEAISHVRDIERVVVADKRDDALERFVDRFEDRFDVRVGSIDEAAGCDVLSTVTPVESPIVSADSVGPHTHINAIGADAPGKNELDHEILRRAKLVIDDYEQCTHSGEINVPWTVGTLTADDIYAELAAVVADDDPGRTPADGITVFDSTGLAIQDVAAAHVAYQAVTTDDQTDAGTTDAETTDDDEATDAETETATDALGAESDPSETYEIGRFELVDTRT